MKDNEIIELYFARDEAALEESEKKYGGYCRIVAYNILHDDLDAEECVNDTWLGAWKTIPPHRPKRLSVFLGKITRNLSLNLFKKRNAKKRGFGQTEAALSELEECVPAQTDVEKTAEENLLIESIENFLRALPEQKRNIFIRRYWYFYSVGDIAKTYGITESKTASLLFRMRNELKKHLEKEGIAL